MSYETLTDVYSNMFKIETLRLTSAKIVRIIQYPNPGPSI